MEAPRENTLVSRIVHPRDVETIAESIQADVFDNPLAGVVNGLRAGVDRAGGARADRRTQKHGRREEGCTTDDERLREAAGHVVVKGEQALDVRHRHGLGNAAEIDLIHASREPEWVRGIDADRAIRRRDTRAIRPAGRSCDQNFAGGDLSACVDVVCRVVQVHRVRTGKMVDAARKVPAELEREVEFDAAGDRRRLLRIVQPAREVQLADVDGTGSPPSGHAGVEQNVALDRSPRPRQLDVGAELRERSFKGGIE